MKKKTNNTTSIVVYLIIMFLITSCSSFLAFQEPQPTLKKNESSFDKNFQGMYFNPLDSSILTITESTMYLSHFFMPEKPISEVRPNAEVGPTDTKFSDFFSPEIPNITESTYNNWEEIDTAFSISEDNILRKYNGRHLLNYRELDGYWYLELMTLNNEEITVSTFFVEDFEMLEDQLPVKKIYNESGEISRLVVKPTRKQLRKLMQTQEFLLKMFIGYRINEEQPKL